VSRFHTASGASGLSLSRITNVPYREKATSNQTLYGRLNLKYYTWTFLTNSDFNFIAPMPSILQSIL